MTKRMGRKETLFVFITILRFAFLASGNSSRSFVMSRENDLGPAKHPKLKNKGIVKIIKMKDNDFLSCVDVYKQPAFQHPLLKNHTLQWMPTTVPLTLGNKISMQQMKLSNSLSENALCPKKTIPVLSLPKSSPESSTGRRFEFALLKLIRYPDDMFLGGSAFINVNSPECGKDQSSGASIWLGSDISNQTNFIKAGWMVHPQVYGDSKPRLSIHWTGDGYHHTGCYDLLCPGFIQVNNDIALGLPLSHVTTHGSNESYVLDVKIFQDAMTKDWWLTAGNDFGSQLVGYWPKELFPQLGGGATVLRFGGSVMTRVHAFPPMGDSYMPDGDSTHSNYFHQIHYVNKSNYLVPPHSLGVKVFSDNPRCYRLLYVEKEKENFGSSLYMGGPGGDC